MKLDFSILEQPWPMITDPWVIARFERHFEKVDGCWLWNGGHSAEYAGFNLGHLQQGAHCVSWRIYKGSLPRKVLVLHSCDIRPCVNPEHLYLGTQLNNMQDASNRGRVRNRGKN